MKTSFVPFTALSLLLVTGCSIFGEPDSELPIDTDTPAPTRPSQSDPPPPAPLEGTPVVDELTESFGMFVTAKATPGGDGSRMKPFATLRDAIAAAKPNKKRVYVCEGTYREAITIADGVSMVGGLDCSNPSKWSLGDARSRIESPSIPAVSATSIDATTRFERFDVTAPNGDATTPTSIALFAKDAGALTIAKSRFVAGNGADGANGVAPPSKSVGPNADGKLGPASGRASPLLLTYFPHAGGEGGTSACGGPAGGAGGTGGLWRAYYDPTNGIVTYSVFNNDTPANGARGGESGSGGVTNGNDGASATVAGTFTPEGFVPANGTVGTNGSPGQSGKGGSGHKATDQSAANNAIFWGHQGGGGGAGGCGGDAGTAGTGGGASIAVMLVDAAVTFVESELVAKKGGAGGQGSFGSAPTPGGKGAPALLVAPGTGGQDGTPGGLAGISGSGAGGSSVVLARVGAEPKVQNTKLVVGQAGSGVAAMTNGTKTIPASANGEALEKLAVAQ